MNFIKIPHYQQECLSKLHDIHSRLVAAAEIFKNPGLMLGKAGLALYFGSYYEFTGRKDIHSEDIARKLITSCFDDINNGLTSSSLAGGITGICMAAEYLVSAGILDKKAGGVYYKLDDFLINNMLAEIQNGNYDYLHAALGNALYLLNRPKTKQIKSALIKLVDELDKLKNTDSEHSFAWESVLTTDTKFKGINLGLAHGLPAVIYIMALMYHNNINREKCMFLVKGAIQYLLDQQLNPGLYYSNFPNWIVRNETPQASRLAWCYGDPGIGIALFQTARLIRNVHLEKKAIEILLHATKRLDPLENLVNNAAFCHGSAGLVQIFTRMYQYTGMQDFMQSSNYWLDYILKSDLEAQFPGERENDYSLLEGIAGIGLVLITVMSKNETTWDRILLLS